jgi:integrase
MRGHVARRGDSWAWMFDVGPDPATGKRRRRSRSGYKTQRAATAAMRTAMRAAETGTVEPGEAPTVAAYINEWLAGRRQSLRPSTWAGYKDALEGRVVPRLGALRIDRVTAKHIADLVAELVEHGGRDDRRGPGLASKTVRATITVLNRVFADAVRRGLIARNPAEHVDRPRVVDKEMAWWTVDEARRFLDHVAGDRLEALWTLALTTGMRRGELLGLKWGDIDFDAGRLAIRRTLIETANQVRWSEPKTAASRRVVALDPGTVALLRTHRRLQLEERLAVAAGYMDDRIVFASISGECLHPASVSKAFGRYVEAAGVPRIRFHDLRHTAATMMLEQGVPLKVVTERLGHSSTRITADLYQHVGETMQDDAARRLGAALLGPPR